MPYAETTVDGLTLARNALASQGAAAEAALRTIYAFASGITVADPTCAASILAVAELATAALAALINARDPALAAADAAIQDVVLAEAQGVSTAASRVAANSRLDGLEFAKSRILSESWLVFAGTALTVENANDLTPNITLP